MGDVYVAHDPELDRRVAIKVIRSQITQQSPRVRVRFLREAQALARLNHPNIVAVYDCGTFDDHMFVAMELVEGPTLAAWLAAGPRTAAEITHVFLRAGRGLAAAHAAGITHRDFKPSNVMLGERVRVVDFGLARATDDDTLELGASAPMLNTLVTGIGDRVGTPAYMAPEQHIRATGLSDQYSFAVAFHEALTGTRPDSATPPVRPVPGWLRPILARALALRPEDRFPSMDALLTVLARGSRWPRGRRALAAALAAFTGALATVAAVALWPGRATVDDPCGETASLLAPVWDTSRRDAVHASLVASRLPHAEDVWRMVRVRLDGYAGDWTAMAVEACRAARVDGRQSGAMLDLRMKCLDQRRSVFGELTALWSTGMDVTTAVYAIDATRALPPLSECADTRALEGRVPWPSDPAAASAIAAARTKLDAVLALAAAHRWAEAGKAVTAVRAEAERAGWPQLRAEAAFAEGDLLSKLEETSAEPALLDAVRLAGEAHDDRLAARSLIALVSHLAYDRQDAERALRMAEIADGAVARAGNDPEQRALVLAARSEAHHTRGHYDEAAAALAGARELFVRASGAGSLDVSWIDAQQANIASEKGDYATASRVGNQALVAAVAGLGPEHPRVAGILGNLGKTSELAGDHAAAAAYYRRALDIKQAIYGPDSASVATTLNNLGGVEGALGHPAAAGSLFEQALRIRERALGPEHSFVASTLGNLGTVRRAQGRYAEAEALIQRALAISTKADGAAHPSVAYKQLELGHLARVQGDHARALDWFRRAHAVRRGALGPDHPMTLEALAWASGELAALGRCAEARPSIATATAGLENAVGAEHPDLATAIAISAECHLAAGATATAVTELTRALAIDEHARTEPVQRGAHRWQLARALWAANQHDPAIAAARIAARELASNADGHLLRPLVHDWLTARGAAE